MQAKLILAADSIKVLYEIESIFYPVFPDVI